MTEAEQKVKELIDSIGALGEMLKVYRDSLLDNGFTRSEAIEMCMDMVRAQFNK